MKFRPCIDIHNGQVKQIVGGSLHDQNNEAKENFVSKQDASFYADLYKKEQLKGGHIILLNPAGSEYYEEDCRQAGLALKTYPEGLQLGGGITAENAMRFLDMGATHVIVTSYVFKDGHINYDNLNKLVAITGRKQLVLDLSCRRRDDQYYIVTDRWQKFTDEIVNEQTLEKLMDYCDEFLIHAVDVEGKANGVEKELVAMLGKYGDFPITYAGGVSSFEDLSLLKKMGHDHLDVTVGSALDLFGGSLNWQDVIRYCKTVTK